MEEGSMNENSRGHIQVRYRKNFYKCHNVFPPTTTIKKGKKEIQTLNISAIVIFQKYKGKSQ
jgi:hypothetical protein